MATTYWKPNKRGEKVWFLDFCHKGKRVRRRIGVGEFGRKQAEVERKQVEADTDRKRLFLQSDEPLERFVADFTEYFQANCSFQTKRRYNFTLRFFTKFCKEKGITLLSQISRKTIEDFKAWSLESRGAKARTINADLKTLRSAFSLTVRYGHMNDNPAAGIKLLKEPEKRPRIMDKEQIKAILAALTDEVRPMVMLGLYTGARRGEIFNLLWDDVDFKKRLIHIRNRDSFTTKSFRERAVPINTQLFDFLEQLPRRGKFVIPSSVPDRFMAATNLGRIYKRILKRLGLGQFRFHDLRHCFISYLLENGVNPAQVIQFSGHADLQILNVYSHSMPNQGHEDIAKLRF